MDYENLTLSDLIQRAGELLGTDPEYRNIGTVMALMHHYERLCEYMGVAPKDAPAELPD